MRPIRAMLSFAALATMIPAVQAHGALAVNELETYAIGDFEGQEDSFAWEGFEIWDVYVGDGYSEAHAADGVYFKVNFAGDGSQRPTGSTAWTIDFAFKVGDQAFERSLSHDGADVATDFEELDWIIADGNVLQIRAWVPVPDAKGQAVTDVVVVSSVDGDRRDVAPGGIFLPGAGTEVPVEAPATPVFPPLGEGRIVDAVPVTGPEKFINVTIAPQGAGVFELTVKNPLADQGQHVFLRETAAAGWSLEAPTTSANLDGGASATFQVTLTPTATNGSLDPLPLELYTDIGGRQTHYAYLEGDEVLLTSDPATAHSATIGEAEQEAPGPGALALLACLAFAFVSRRRMTRR